MLSKLFNPSADKRKTISHIQGEEEDQQHEVAEAESFLVSFKPHAHILWPWPQKIIDCLIFNVDV